MVMAVRKAYLGLILVLILLVGYVSIGRNPSKPPSSSREKPSIFLKIFTDYETNSTINRAINGNHLWDRLDPNPCNGTITTNATVLNQTARENIELFRNLSAREESRRDLIGVLLLNDLREDVGGMIIKKKWALIGLRDDICALNERLRNFDAYKEKALEVYGEPKFSYEDLYNFSMELKAIVSDTYRPFSGSWVVDTRSALLHFLYRGISNGSIPDYLFANYSPEKSAATLKRVYNEIRADPYAEALFGPSLAYLAAWWKYEDMHTTNHEAVDDKYLRLFWAWYNLVKPKRFIGG